MDPGRRDQRVTLQVATVTRDSAGAPVEAWSDFATVWGRVGNLSARQTAQAQQVDAAVRKAVAIRWLSGATSSMRLRFADGTFAKVSWIEDDYRADRMILVCEDFNG